MRVIITLYSDHWDGVLSEKMIGSDGQTPAETTQEAIEYLEGVKEVMTPKDKS